MEHLDQGHGESAALLVALAASYSCHPLERCIPQYPDCIPSWSAVATCRGALLLLLEVVVNYGRHPYRRTWDTLVDTLVGTSHLANNYTYE